MACFTCFMQNTTHTTPNTLTTPTALTTVTTATTVAMVTVAGKVGVECLYIRDGYHVSITLYLVSNITFCNVFISCTLLFGI